jgi:hypothetical protein
VFVAGVEYQNFENFHIFLSKMRSKALKQGTMKLTGQKLMDQFTEENLNLIKFAGCKHYNEVSSKLERIEECLKKPRKGRDTVTYLQDTCTRLKSLIAKFSLLQKGSVSDNNSHLEDSDESDLEVTEPAIKGKRVNIHKKIVKTKGGQEDSDEDEEVEERAKSTSGAAQKSSKKRKVESTTVDDLEFHDKTITPTLARRYVISGDGKYILRPETQALVSKKIVKNKGSYEDSDEDEEEENSHQQQNKTMEGIYYIIYLFTFIYLVVSSTW